MRHAAREERPLVPTRPVTLAVTVGVVASAAAAYVFMPDGIGAVVFGVTIGLLCLLIGVGPWLYGARPLRLWLPVPIGALCLLTGAAMPGAMGSVASLGPSDVAYAAGYLCFGGWLLVMSWHVGREIAARAVLDAALAMTGLAVTAWTVAYAFDGDHVVRDLLMFRYPLLDVVMIVLASHLIVRLGRWVRVWWWIFGALDVLLLVDTSYAVVSSLGGGRVPVLTAGYLVGFAALALAATHPSIVHLSTTSAPPVDRSRPALRAALICLAALPAVVAVAFPTFGETDRFVRSFLLTMLLTLLFARLLVTAIDLSRARASAARLATRDDLTGLPNRAALLEELTRRLTEGDDAEGATAVILIACDDLEDVNDTWGRWAGDRLLQEAADRLRGVLLPGQVLGRRSDRFVLLADVDGRTEALGLARRLTHLARLPFSLATQDDHRSSFSVGIALARPGDQIMAATVMGHADTALTEARHRPRDNVVLFDAEVEERAVSRARIGLALRTAIRQDAFAVHFQPIVGGADYGALVGWEALARWTDETLGVIPPDVFIPIAEDLGLIDDLGRLVLSRACRELAQLRRSLSRGDLTVSVNVSAPQLLRADFADFVAGALRAAGLPADCLWLEITETVLVDRGDEVMRTLETIRSSGVRVTIDDFGTGYASLESLRRLPVDGVKIDRSLVARLAEGKAPAQQLEHLVDLLRSFGVTHLVAEGVETREQEAVLRSLGCPFVQGWFYGRPGPAQGFLGGTGRGATRWSLRTHESPVVDPS